MALDTFNPYLFVSAGEQSNKYLTPGISPDGIASFQAQRAQDLTGLTVRINLIQEGTGDPSPDNIRPISGRTGMTVTVQSGETQNEYPVTWQTEAGTVYGGTLDVVSGVLTVTHAAVDMGTLKFILSSSVSSIGGSVFQIPISELGMAIRYRYTPNTMLSSIFATAPAERWFIITMPDNEVFSNETNIYFSASQYTDVTAFKTAMSGVQLVYELATPQTYQLDPEDVMTLPGFNQIYSDAGPVIDIKF